MPGFLIDDSAINYEKVINKITETKAPDHASTRIKTVVNVLLNFGRFLARAKGDMDTAEKVYRKAVEIDPDDSIAIASLAHFLSSVGSTSPRTRDESIALFSR
jgi:Tfp pilus assembly protein PilF